MSLTTQIVNLFFAHRRGEIDFFMQHGVQVQHNQFEKLLAQARDTDFGRRHGFGKIRTPEQFAARVEVTDYEAFEGLIARSRGGEENVTWPGGVDWFAKSSGTTGSRSKFIPVTEDGLRECHLRGPMDVVSFFAALYPRSKVFSGKTLTLGGSHRLESTGGRAQEGDLSAILIENTPKWADWRRAPKTATALIPDFEEKVRAICAETVGQRITAFAGVPSWNLVMLNKILEYTGKDNVLEVWPEMELFIHGGMNFKPYRSQYQRIFPSEQMKYLETYNASEGFFGIQNEPGRDDMLLMLDYGIFYEFLPVSSLHDTSKAVPLEGVRTGENYALIISSCNGLWRYQIGDTVEFTSTSPYKFKITGRTKHFINAFGEEIIIDNAETALHEACEATGARISDYTAGPVYMGDRSQGSHQWLVEFSREPESLDQFTELLDKGLQRVNSDYEAKRFKNTTLLSPTLTPLPEGTFYRWMQSRGKVGGQNKVPRLYNDRTYLDQLLALRE